MASFEKFIHTFADVKFLTKVDIGTLKQINGFFY